MDGDRKHRGDVVVLEHRTPAAVDAQHGGRGVLHGIFHGIIHGADHQLDEVLGLDHRSVHLIDKRLPGKKLIHVNAGCIDLVDQREGAQKAAGVDGGRCDGRFEDNPS